MMRGARRLRASDQGPPANWPAAKPTKKAVSVRPTRDAVVLRSAATIGKAGVYMSVANGGTAFWSAIVPTRTAETGTTPLAAGSVGGTAALFARRSG